MKIKIAILTILAALFTATTVYAQIGEMRHNFAVGVNAGINMSSVSFQPSVKQKSLMGINGGFTARYISEKYFAMICGAQVELNFSQKGWDEFNEDYPDLKYTRTMTYVDIPFLAHLAFGRDRGMQFFLNLGPQIGFLLGDSEKQEGDWQSVIDNPYSYITTEQHGKSIDNRFDYGIAGGAGLELRTKAGNFLVEGRYYYALSDFYNSSKKDYFSRSAHGTITVKLTYLFDLTK